MLSNLFAGQVVAPAAGRGPCSRSSSAQRGCASCRRRSSGSGARGSPSTSRGACCGDSNGAAQGAAGRGGGAAAAFGRLRCGVHDGGIGARPAAARRRQLRRVILGILQMIHTPADPQLWQQPAQCRQHHSRASGGRGSTARQACFASQPRRLRSMARLPEMPAACRQDQLSPWSAIPVVSYPRDQLSP